MDCDHFVLPFADVRAATSANGPALLPHKCVSHTVAAEDSEAILDPHSIHMLRPE